MENSDQTESDQLEEKQEGSLDLDLDLGLGFDLDTDYDWDLKNSKDVIWSQSQYF